MKKIFNYLMISNIFTGGFVFTTELFDLYLSYLFIFFFTFSYIFSHNKLNINRKFIYILVLFSFFSFLNVLLGNNSISFLSKTVVGFIVNGIPYYLLIRLNDNNIDKLFRIYLKLACVVALIGVFQEISFLVGFEYGYDFRFFIPRMVAPHSQLGMLKVTSIIPEPAHFGAVMAPAIFVSILNIFQKKKYFISQKMSCLIIISVMLSFSLVAYLSIVVVFILIMLNYKRVQLITVFAIILGSLMFTTYKHFPEFRFKINDTVSVISGNVPLYKVNLSTFAFCSNGFVAYKSFMSNPLIGSGLGSHPMSYDRYIAAVIDSKINKWALNRKDASALFFRVVSETGLIGIFLVFSFMFKFHVSRKKDDYLWIISNAITCLFVLKLLRQGNYFYNGFFFFVWVYYFAYKNMPIKARFLLEKKYSERE
ncbi:MAG: hypothetical protein GY853_11620 [PVC group bacterium]|nr:hypothetical protein [PVC group bacterium]